MFVLVAAILLFSGAMLAAAYYVFAIPQQQATTLSSRSGTISWAACECSWRPS